MAHPIPLALAAAGTVTASPVTAVMHHLLVLHGPPAYAIVAALAFGEAAIFIGFVLPGETAVLLGGVLASQHAVSLPWMIAIVVVSAIAGDSVGYEVGRHFGERVLNLRFLAPRRRAIDGARNYLRAKGGRAVFLGRFTAFLRAVMPGLAGLSRMHYWKFLAFNAAGGIVWGVGFTLLGYLAGASYNKVERVAGWASTGLLILFAVLLVGVYLYRRRAERAEIAELEDSADDADSSPDSGPDSGPESGPDGDAVSSTDPAKTGGQPSREPRPSPDQPGEKPPASARPV